MKRITIELSPSWVLLIAPNGTLPSEIIANYVHSNNLGTVKESSFTDIVFDAEAMSDQEFSAFTSGLMAFLSTTFRENAPQLSKDVFLSMEKVSAPAPEKKLEKQPEKAPEKKPVKEPEKRAPIPVKPEAPAPAPKSEAPSVMDQIRHMQGARQFIALCENIQKMAPLLCQRSLQSVLTSISYIFSIDPGCGHSSALKLLSQLLNQEGLLTSRDAPVEMKLAAESGQNKPLEEAAQKLTRCKNKVVSLDISNWCDKVTSPDFRDFLLKLRGNSASVVYVFRLPYLEHSVLADIETALADVMRVQTVVFSPLTAEELELISRELLEARGFRAAEDAWDQFQHRLAEEKSDGRFYGIKTAENIVDDMIFLKLQAILRGDSLDDGIITAADLTALTAASAQSVSAQSLLDGMIGIESIRDRIYEIISQIEFARKTPGVSAPAMHMRFIGCPGTGKTTVARIMGQLLKERGILSKGYFFEHSGGDFIGMYVGHTAPKTLALCRDAYGSILFIDEAYTLANANYRDGNGFAKEAIDTLIAQMENHRDDMVVIMAGYPREMAQLMQINPGLPGRMPYVLEFPNYNREQLAQIFASMVRKSSFSLAPDVQGAVEDYFQNLGDNVVNGPDFANARFVRNIFERTWSKTVTRAQIDGSDPSIITRDDFAAATADSTDTISVKTAKRSRPGYHLGLV